ncbi:MAG: aldolase/citrate lyase family protein [Pseudomonadota bacterium]
MKKLIESRLRLKKKLQDRQKVFAGWNSFYHPSITEIFAKTGLDLIGIDIEHSTISVEQSQRIMVACHSLDTVCLSRIASHSMESIKRQLDAGADGIIAPMVNTAEEAKQLINWIKYPPVGKRSFGVARAQGYGLDYDEYVNSWNDSSIFIAQIESVQGVENIDSILDLKDLDGVMIGPYDLSGSLGLPGQLDHPDVKKACEKVVAACKKHGKSCGTQIVEVSEQNIQNALDSGYTFIVVSSDLFLMWKWAERTGEILRKMGK